MEKLYQPALVRPDEFGFGTEIMKHIKVCRHCGSSESSDSYLCKRCRERLPSQTLFELYQQMHAACEICDTVLAPYMRYCPHCGVQIKSR